jgi:hypothetical protein
MEIEGDDRATAEMYIDFLNLQVSNPDIEFSSKDAEGCFEHAEPVGIDIDIYMDFKSKTSGLASEKDANGKTTISKKSKVLRVINSLPLSPAQKDALYYASGYKESTIDEAPWH